MNQQVREGEEEEEDTFNTNNARGEREDVVG